MPRSLPRLASARRSWACLWLVAAAVLVQAPGCGCRQETPEERAARLAKVEAERLERERQQLEEARLRAPVQLPPAKLMPTGDDAASLFVKPGHWNAVRQPAKANAQDFDGVISYEVTQGRGDAAGLSQRLVSRRPLVVARHSEKAVDSLFYCPPTGALTPRLVSTVRERRSGAPVVDEFPLPLRPLQDHQYHFVVLGREPGRYGFLESLFSFRATLESRVDTSELDRNASTFKAENNYRLVAVPTRDAAVEIALPDNPLAWTSIAYVLWDDVDPAVLTRAQRDALVDWVNWGGQLIVSGPNSLELLRGSFLEPLLPAEDAGAQEINAARLTRLELEWAAGSKGKTLNKEKPWQGVTLRPAERASSPPGLEGLVVERRVGRGRVVVTAFALTDPRLAAWSRGVDNLVNGALLRRPPREFVPSDLFVESGPARAAVRWANREAPIRLDPLANSGFRTFVRDSNVAGEPLAAVLVEEEVDSGGFGGFGGATPPAQAGVIQPETFYTLRPARTPGGAGAVSDFGAVAGVVRTALRESAGVSVPDSGFVFSCLAAYLFVLVPANWAFFAAIRRVELAWVAAPVIALVGAWVVIQQARLDIGFVRSRTEVGVLEVQPDTPRALLTRFTALYTSLSTTYEMEFDNPAVAAPFPRGTALETFGDVATVAYERQEKSRLKDIVVSSATTEFVRSEEMLDVSAVSAPGSSIPGSVRLAPGPSGAPRLENRTAWDLQDTLVVGRPDGLRGEPRLEGCWVGDLGPGEVASVVFLPLETFDGEEGTLINLPFPRERSEAARLRGDRPGERLDLAPLLRLALDPERYEPGERRVVAVIPQVIDGVTITPRSSQRTGATLLVNHLGYGPLPAPKHDVNGPLDVGG